MIRNAWPAVYVSLFLLLAMTENVFGDTNLSKSGQVQEEGKIDEIQKYLDTIANEGSNEEVWYAKFKLGEINEIMGQWDKALEYYLEAYQFNPGRAEPLEKLSKYYRLQGQNNLAYLFAAHGSKIPHPPENSLFVSPQVYDYRFDEELSIAAYYTPFKDEGLAAIERLTRNKKAPASVRYNAENNMRFYLQNLKNVRLINLPIRLPLLREGSTLRCLPANPSILKTDDGYIAICRCVNFTQRGAMEYKLLEPRPDGKVLTKTRNFLLKYDKDFKLLSQKEIIDEISGPMKHKPHTDVEGIEDSRIFKYENALWATCVIWDTNEYHIPQTCLYRLADPDSSPSTDKSRISVDYFIPLQGPDPKRCEKNWLPFIKDGKIYTIYSYDPLIVNQVDPATGRCKEVIRHEQTNDYTTFRGSAAPIKFDEGYLVVIHQVAFANDGRHYFHRFLKLDNDFQITHVSKPFTYDHNGVEFCCGMTVDHSGKNLIMSLGIEDRQAMLAFVDFDTIRSLLVPIR